MKLISALFLLLLTTNAYGADVTVNFTWIANDPAEEITGYKLYMDNVAPEVAVIPDPAAVSTSYTFDDGDIAHSFSLVAYRDSDGTEPYIQSDHSKTAIHVPKPIIARPIKAVGTFTIEFQ